MNTVCARESCTGCKACVAICGRNAISIKDELMYYDAVIDHTKCISCGLCRKVCPNNQEVDYSNQLVWYQGWSQHHREKSSSGGVARSIMEMFVKNGGVVCSCVFQNGKFVFELSDRIDDLDKYTGSKYIKSDMRDIYPSIRKMLFKQRKVLFIGLPCQVAGIKKYVGDMMCKNLYTVDLICHGTPTVKLLDMYFQECGFSLCDIGSIEFRKKTDFCLFIDGNRMAMQGMQDVYTYAFLNAIDYTENCYSCKYATSNRISDITIGDSWGSELPIEEQKKGVSLILCQTEKGKMLVQESDLHLEKVDIENARSCNHQLISPSLKPDSRSKFFQCIIRGNGFEKAVNKCAPKWHYRQLAKKIFYSIKKISGRRGK